MNEKDPALVAVDRRWRLRGLAWLGVAIVLAALTLGVYFSLGLATRAAERVTEVEETGITRDLRINSLEEALQAQRD